MTPPGARRSIAVGRTSSSASSSPLTAMRRAWNVRVAGWPPVRRAAAGMASRTSSASSTVVVGAGSACLMARAIRRAKRSSP
jgi:hypothetical protein